MSRKTTSKPAPAQAGGTDLASLAGTANAALAAGRYKDAIEQFKALLKCERRAGWLQALAAAYAGRAGQLAAKGMLKEAIALWRTRAESCGVPLLEGPFLGWLLRDGQVAQALQFLPRLETLPPEAHAQLAAAVLVAPDGLLAGLPPDSPLRQHRAAAQAALAASTGGDPAALDQALQAISFRSPYRDLRPLLKALAMQASDPLAASASLARVAAGGPFDALRQALQVCLLPGPGWLAGMRQLDEAQRTLVLDLKGCPQGQRRLVLELLARDADAALPPLDLFNLVMRQRREIGEPVARQACLRLLPHVPQRMDAFEATFQPLEPAQEQRILALAAELKQRPDQAEDRWLPFIRLVGSTPAGARSAALVLRRLAESHMHHGTDGELCVHAVAWLEQSLQLDPADRASHLSLIRDARRSGDLKLARSRLDAATRLLPDDPLLLQEAVETALASGAFKKAAGLAKQVLKLDPINPRVRTLVGQAHVAHARKQIGMRNLAGARRELDEAAGWFRGAGEQALVTLLRGFAADSEAAAEAQWRAAIAAWDSPLVGAFHLLLEGRRTRQDAASGAADLPRRAGVDLSTTPGAKDLVALAQALNTQPERDRTTGSVLDALRSALDRAAKAVRLAESEDLLLCEAMHRQGHVRLTQVFAKAAQQRWPGRPVFVYLELSARFGAHPERMGDGDFDRLDSAFVQAQAQGDERTAARSRRLLEAADGPDLDDLDIATELDFMDGGNMAAEMEKFLLAMGEDALLDMLRRQLGKADFEQLRRDIGGSSKKEFARAVAQLLANNDFGPAAGALPPRGKPFLVPLPKRSR